MTEGEALSAIRGNDPALAAKAETALWQVWCRSGIREVDLLLRQGIEAIERQEPMTSSRIRASSPTRYGLPR